MLQPRKIRQPDDIRPGTKKGKLDKKPIWLVEIMMPKKLIMDIFGSYKEMEDMLTDPMEAPQAGAQEQPADALAAAPPIPGGEAPPAPGGETPPAEGAV